MSTIVRYSDAELAEFRAIIEDKISRAKEQLEALQQQIVEITENVGDEHGGDWVDDSSINNEVEMLNNMAIRQRMYLQDLENAMVRIENKTYGVCVVSGDLIDKKRLLAVPTTTKSMAAKTMEVSKTPTPSESRSVSLDDIEGGEAEERPRPSKSSGSGSGSSKVITKVIKKTSAAAKVVAPKKAASEEDEDDDIAFDDDIFFEEASKMPKQVGGEEFDDLLDEETDDSMASDDDGLTGGGVEDDGSDDGEDEMEY